MDKDKCLDKLRKLHDEIKEHPFRYNFSEDYVDDYKELLY